MQDRHNEIVKDQENNAKARNRNDSNDRKIRNEDNIAKS